MGPRPAGGYKGCNAKLVLVTRASRFRDNDIASLISFNSPEVPGSPIHRYGEYNSNCKVPRISAIIIASRRSGCENRIQDMELAKLKLASGIAT